MTFLDIVLEVAGLFWSWRVYLCVVPAVLVAGLLHAYWPEAGWLWCLTAPGVLTALAASVRWEYRSS